MKFHIQIPPSIESNDLAPQWCVHGTWLNGKQGLAFQQCRDDEQLYRRRVGIDKPPRFCHLINSHVIDSKSKEPTAALVEDLAKTEICWFCLDFCTRERITIFGNVRALSVDKKVTNSEVFFANNVSNLCSSSIKSHVFWRRPLQRGEWQSCQSKAFLSFHTSCLSKGNLKYSKQLAVLSEAFY